MYVLCVKEKLRGNWLGIDQSQWTPQKGKIMAAPNAIAATDNPSTAPNPSHMFGTNLAAALPVPVAFTSD
ncbi:uncharacterized protein N7484_010326 [Penicillium longicatenatum]|uniref:uncharacterized protein n=1 Tax=Penicillium longicatenatum TaxID=1561947 RepID=UPI002546A146|nr:uncharacterized protein N7484_010326 [Penicillium longicatenatum]KAJ5630226.1 hypothetical protein N7484_010326 [Penicillium longicatenatum]